ncbi:MAG: family 10 glycosylhydrolase [Saprospiraceae bacterium]|nr:family 10 glycosylhydrolase [Saprospiraceae bacterium]
MKKRRLLVLCTFSLLFLSTISGQNKSPQTVLNKPKLVYNLTKGTIQKKKTYVKIKPLTNKRPSPKQELRGVWVSTVHRVDFPNNATSDPSVLRAEWLKLLKFYKSLNLNAVIVQVRPTADAIYPSKLVPYSKWLTGQSGKPLWGNFDLLKFMVETSHTEGLEFHAWVNPYRVFVDSDTLNLAPNHVFRTHRNWILKYGKEHHLNPGIPEVRKHIVSVIEEIVQNYRIDAIHFDDYFYPYRIKDEFLQDSMSFKLYGRKFPNIDDWRRANNDSLIAQVRQIIKKHKPFVQLGVSPFAVWKNKTPLDIEGSATKAYQSCYGDLYANVLLWLRKGWLDYVAPEVYFHKGHPLVDYETAVDWWLKNSYGTPVYISHAIYKVNNQEKYPEWRDPQEIPRQLDIVRSKPKVKGLVFFSSKWLMQNPLGVTDSIRTNFFYQPAQFPQVKN